MFCPVSVPVTACTKGFIQAQPLADGSGFCRQESWRQKLLPAAKVVFVATILAGHQSVVVPAGIIATKNRCRQPKGYIWSCTYSSDNCIVLHDCVSKEWLGWAVHFRQRPVH